jgi:diguanylate cyclase (GGDEF)-like protein
VLVVTWPHRVAGVEDGAVRAVAVLAAEAGVALRHAKLIEDLEKQASTVTLTGIPNRRGWNAQLAALLDTLRATGRPLTVAVADLDHFKSYNDINGHQRGDLLLHRFALDALAILRPGDVIARWGGEEFFLALPACSSAQATPILERIRQCVPDEQTCSIGYAAWNQSETLEHLMNRADKALYAAKNAGRNRIQPDPADIR